MGAQKLKGHKIWGCTKIRGAKIKGTKFKGVRILMGIRYLEMWSEDSFVDGEVSSCGLDWVFLFLPTDVGKIYIKYHIFLGLT